MAWFRRSRPTTEPVAPDLTTEVDTPTDVGDGEQEQGTLVPVPVPSAAALERTERALRMLATQSSQLHEHLFELEQRIDALSAGMFDRLDLPTYDDVLEARTHSAKVASELARLEVNVAARLEAVIGEVRGTTPAVAEIDLRTADANATGWPSGATR